VKSFKHILPLEWQFSQLALEKASEAIFGVDAKANIYRVNEAACRFLGYSRKELTRLTVFDIDPNYTPGNWPEITQKIKDNGVLVFESSIRAKNGSILPIEVAANHSVLLGDGCGDLPIYQKGYPFKARNRRLLSS
jgi:PAS domain S-box-containing protein